MKTSRLEAFSDGVLAIIITIMVLTLNVPYGDTLNALWKAVGAGFLAYVLSFVYVGIYWNNHHHLFQLVDRVSASVLWANLHLLFWLSLLPLTTAWMAATDLARTPTVVYAANLVMAGVAYWLLGLAITRLPGDGPRYREAVGADSKGLISVAMYLVSIGLAFVEPWLAVAIFVGVAIMWLIPDRRIQRFLHEESLGQASDTST